MIVLYSIHALSLSCFRDKIRKVAFDHMSIQHPALLQPWIENHLQGRRLSCGVPILIATVSMAVARCVHLGLENIFCFSHILNKKNSHFFTLSYLHRIQPCECHKCIWTRLPDLCNLLLLSISLQVLLKIIVCVSSFVLCTFFLENNRLCMSRLPKIWNICVLFCKN